MLSNLARSVAVATLVGLGAAGAAHAQSEPAPMPEVTMPDEQAVDRFVGAVEQVMPIQADAQTRIEQAQSEEEAQAILAEAQEAAIAAIEDEGLTLEEYNQMAALLQTNEAFRDDVLGRLSVE